MEPRVGGRWYERDVEGKPDDWGKVLAWDPPHRVAFSWHVGPGHDQPDWVCDPDPAKASEVEIRFTAEGPETTLVELAHSKLERHGEGYEQLRAIFDGPGAWMTFWSCTRRRRREREHERSPYLSSSHCGGSDADSRDSAHDWRGVWQSRRRAPPPWRWRR